MSGWDAQLAELIEDGILTPALARDLEALTRRRDSLEREIALMSRRHHRVAHLSRDGGAPLAAIVGAGTVAGRRTSTTVVARARRCVDVTTASPIH